MATGKWHEALQTDGQFIMAQVTQRLYEGGNLRPDAYYEKVPGLGRMKYKSDFNWMQKKIIESCDRDFDIRDAAAEFDVSLHWVLQKNTCGLEPVDDLYKLLKKLVEKRNNFCHGREVVNEDNIDEKLDDLLSLYIKILDRLEERSFCNLWEVKKQIRNSIEKKLDWVDIPSSPPRTAHTREVVRYNASRQKESPEWGKALAIGGGVAVAGAAVVGLASLLSSGSKSQNEKKERQRASNRTSSQEECVVM